MDRFRENGTSKINDQKLKRLHEKAFWYDQQTASFGRGVTALLQCLLSC